MNDTYEALIECLTTRGFGSVDDWFTTAEINDLRQALMDRYRSDDFRLAGIGSKFNFQRDTAIRNDRIRWLDRSTELLAERRFFAVIDDFTDYLNRTCFAGIREIEFHYAVYEPGSFYRRHADRFDDNDQRRFTLVMYLTENWQPGDGGELVIYHRDGSHVVEPPPAGWYFSPAAWNTRF